MGHDTEGEKTEGGNEEKEEVQGNIKEEDKRGREENVENTKTKREARSETLIPSPSPLKANQQPFTTFDPQTQPSIFLFTLLSTNIHKSAESNL